MTSFLPSDPLPWSWLLPFSFVISFSCLPPLPPLSTSFILHFLYLHLLHAAIHPFLFFRYSLSALTFSFLCYFFLLFPVSTSHLFRVPTSPYFHSSLVFLLLLSHSAIFSLPLFFHILLPTFYFLSFPRFSCTSVSPSGSLLLIKRFFLLF